MSAAAPFAHRILQSTRAADEPQALDSARSLSQEGRAFESARPGTEYTFAAGSTSRSVYPSVSEQSRYQSAISSETSQPPPVRTAPADHLLHPAAPAQPYQPETSVSDEKEKSSSTTRRVIQGGILQAAPRTQADSPIGLQVGGTPPVQPGTLPGLLVAGGTPPSGGTPAAQHTLPGLLPAGGTPPKGGNSSGVPPNGGSAPSQGLPHLPHPSTPNAPNGVPPPPNPPSGNSPYPYPGGPPGGNPAPVFAVGGVQHVLVQEASKQGWKRSAGKPFENHHGPAFWQELKVFTLQVGVGLVSGNNDPTIHGPPLTPDGAVGIITTRLELTHQGLKDHDTPHNQSLQEFTELLKKPDQLAVLEGRNPEEDYIVGAEFWNQATHGYLPAFQPLAERRRLPHHHSWSFRYLFAMTRIAEKRADVGFCVDGSDAVGYTLAVSVSDTATGVSTRQLRVRIDEFLVQNLQVYYLQHHPGRSLVVKHMFDELTLFLRAGIPLAVANAIRDCQEWERDGTPVGVVPGDRFLRVVHQMADAINELNVGYGIQETALPQKLKARIGKPPNASSLARQPRTPTRPPKYPPRNSSRRSRQLLLLTKTRCRRWSPMRQSRSLLQPWRRPSRHCKAGKAREKARARRHPLLQRPLPSLRRTIASSTDCAFR